MSKLVVVPILALLLLAAAPTLSANHGPAGHTVVATDFVWTPQNLTIRAGESVTFVNGQGNHNWAPNLVSPVCPLPCTRTYATEGVFPYLCGNHPGQKGTIFVGVPPTVAVTSPTAGGSASGTLTVTGTATHAVHGVQSLQVFVDGHLVGSGGSAPAGSTLSFSVNVDTTPFANGARALLVRAISGQGIPKDETLSVTFANAPTVDVRAVSLSSTTASSTSATLVYVYENHGNTASGAFTARFEYQYKGAWRTIEEVTEPSLDAKGKATRTYVWDDGLHLGRYPVRVTLDAADEIAELSEANNFASGFATWTSPLLPGTDPLEP